MAIKVDPDRIEKLEDLIASKIPKMPKAIVLGDADYDLLRAQAATSGVVGRFTYYDLYVFRKSELIEINDA